MKNLTLKRILKRHKENPQDAELHKIIEKDTVDENEFDNFLTFAFQCPKNKLWIS
jgi:hypothetical protein